MRPFVVSFHGSLYLWVCWLTWLYDVLQQAVDQNIVSETGTTEIICFVIDSYVDQLKIRFSIDA